MRKRALLKSIVKNTVKDISPEQVLQEEYIDPEGIDTVNIFGGYADIEVIGKKNAESELDIRFVTYENGPQISVNVSDGTCDVKVHQEKTHHSLLKIIPAVKLTIVCPANVVATWTVNSTSGDIAIANNQAKCFHLSTHSGDVQTENVYVEQMKVDSTSGDVKITEASGEIICSTSSGDIDTMDVRSSSLLLRASSGDIDMKHIYAEKADLHTSSGDIAGRYVYMNSLHVNTSSGDMKLKHFSGNATGHTSSGDIFFELNEVGLFDLQTSSGDLKMVFPSLELNANIMLHTKSGSMETNMPLKKAGYEKSFSGSFGNGAYQINLRTFSGDLDVHVKE